MLKINIYQIKKPRILRINTIKIVLDRTGLHFNCIVNRLKVSKNLLKMMKVLKKFLNRLKNLNVKNESESK